MLAFEWSSAMAQVCKAPMTASVLSYGPLEGLVGQAGVGPKGDIAQQALILRLAAKLADNGRS